MSQTNESPTKTVNIFITHVDSEGPFLKISGQSDKDGALMVETLIDTVKDSFQSGVGAVSASSLTEGMICAAKYKDGVYYRAKIMNMTNVSRGLVEVHFIDYGNRDTISVSTIRSLDCYPPMLMKMPGQASDYILARIMQPTGKWEDPVILKLQTFLCYNEKALTLEAMTSLYTVVSFPNVIGDVVTDISQHLTQSGFGMPITVQNQITLLNQMSIGSIPQIGWQGPKTDASNIPTKLNAHPEPYYTQAPNIPSTIPGQQTTQNPSNGSYSVSQRLRVQVAPSAISQRLLINRNAANERTHAMRQPQFTESFTTQPSFAGSQKQSGSPAQSPMPQAAPSFPHMYPPPAIPITSHTNQATGNEGAAFYLPPTTALPPSVAMAQNYIQTPPTEQLPQRTGIPMQNLPYSVSTPHMTVTYKSKKLPINSQHRVYVPFAEDGPEQFALQLATDGKALEDMMNDINKRPLRCLTEAPMIGSVCLGRMSGDRVNCRATVMNMSGSQCTLYFVDFGDTETVSYYDIFDIPEEFVRPEMFAMRFCLSGVKRLPKGPVLNEAFKNLVNQKVLTLKVVEPEGPPLIQYGELYLDSKNVLDLLLETQVDDIKLEFTTMEMLPMRSKTPVLVSFVDSCIKFFIQVAEKTDELNNVMEAVANHCENSTSPTQITEGSACCARFPDDGNWYRACILRVGAKILVSYVDYGNEQEVDISDLRTITPELVQLPAQALKCALKGFENKPVETKTSNQLEMLALEKNLTALVTGTVSRDTMLVTLIDESESPPLDIAQRMIALNQPRGTSEVNITSPVEEENVSDFPRTSSPLEDNKSKGYRNDRPQGKNYQARDNYDRGQNQDRNSKPFSEDVWEEDNTQFKIENNNNFQPKKDNQFNSYKRERSDNDEKGFRGDRRERNDGFRKDRHDGGSRSERPGEFRRERKDSFRSDRSEGGGFRNDRNNGGFRNDRTEGGYRKDRTEGGYRNDRTEGGYRNNRTEGGFRNDRSEGDSRNDRNDDRRFKNDRSEGFKSDRPERREREYKSNFTPRDRLEQTEKYENRSQNHFAQVTTKELPNPVSLETKYPEHDIEIGSTDNITVSWFISPESFYIQLLSLQDKFQNLMHRIPEIYTSVRHYKGDITVGASILAKYPEDNVLYRATVMSVKSFGKYIVHYIDFGNKHLVESRDIWQLDQELMDLPKMAIHCSLSGVKAQDGTWKANPAIDACFDGPSLQCVFEENSDGVYKVSLWKGEQSVASLLAENGLAEQAPASVFADEPIDLTMVVGQQIICSVSNVESFDKMHIQLDVNKADIVENAVWNFDLTKLLPLPTEQRTNGTHCVVIHEKNLYRSIVLDCSSPDLIELQLPDYGNIISTNYENVMSLPPELTIYLYQAIQCSLNNYSEEVNLLMTKEELIQNLQGNKFIVYVNDVNEFCLETTFYDINTGSKVAIFEPDEGAYDDVVPLCTKTVFRSNFGLAYVSHAERLNEIYIQSAGDTDNIAELLEKLFNFYEEGSPEPLETFDPEVICAAKSSDGNWYRASIIFSSETNCTVQFTDYGNTESVPIESLKKLDPQFYEPCALSVVVTLGLEVEDTEILAKFIEVTNEKELIVTLAAGDEGWLATMLLNDTDVISLLNVDSPKDEKVVNETLEIQVGAKQDKQEFQDKHPQVIESHACVTEPSEQLVLLTDSIEAYISHIDTPGLFWLQLADKIDKIEEIQAELQENAESYSNLDKLETGNICVAKYTVDEMWYRAEILDSDTDIVTVRFVDYGNTDVLNNTPGSIKVIPEKLSIDGFALKSSVNAVPSGTGQWSELATEYFKEQVGDISIPLQAVIVLKDLTTYVDLFVNGENITEKLVSEGHATKSEETTTGTKVTCFASHINSPSEFFIQLESATQELQNMEAAMIDAENFPELTEKEEGTICAAKYPEDGLWYRAQVIVDGTMGTEVLFMDYGNTSLTTDLLTLPVELKVKPALSRKCTIQKPRDLKTWSQKAELKFTELAAEGATIFEVQFIASGDISVVDLYLDGKSLTEEIVLLCDDLHKSARLTPLGAEHPDLQAIDENVESYTDLLIQDSSNNVEDLIEETIITKVNYESENQGQENDKISLNASSDKTDSYFDIESGNSTKESFVSTEDTFEEANYNKSGDNKDHNLNISSENIDSTLETNESYTSNDTATEDVNTSIDNKETTTENLNNSDTVNSTHSANTSKIDLSTQKQVDCIEICPNQEILSDKKMSEHADLNITDESHTRKIEHLLDPNKDLQYVSGDLETFSDCVDDVIQDLDESNESNDTVIDTSEHADSIGDVKTDVQKIIEDNQDILQDDENINPDKSNRGLDKSEDKQKEHQERTTPVSSINKAEKLTECVENVDTLSREKIELEESEIEDSFSDVNEDGDEDKKVNKQRKSQDSIDETEELPEDSGKINTISKEILKLEDSVIEDSSSDVNEAGDADKQVNKQSKSHDSIDKTVQLPGDSANTNTISKENLKLEDSEIADSTGELNETDDVENTVKTINKSEDNLSKDEKSPEKPLKP